MNKPIIFFVDDEIAKTRDYRDALKLHFRVVHISSYDSHQELIDKIVAEGPSVYVQDIMMPRGEDQRIDIQAGITAAEALKETLITLQIPLILFSNRMVNEFVQEVNHLGFPRELVFVKFKPDTGYADFANFAWRIYQERNPMRGGE